MFLFVALDDEADEVPVAVGFDIDSTFGFAKTWLGMEAAEVQLLPCSMGTFAITDMTGDTLGWIKPDISLIPVATWTEQKPKVL